MASKLGQEGMALLDAQLKLWSELNGRALYSPLRESLKAGGGVLPAGTLLHGIRRFSEAVVASIASRGIMSGELLGIAEDGETHGCADFFKMPADMTVREYMAYVMSPIQEGVMRSSRGERLLTRGVAFIVDPSAEGMSELLTHDGYTYPAMQSFINAPSSRTSLDTAAVLGGVPHGAIAGILADEQLLKDTNAVQTLRNNFPDTPLLDHSGQLH